MRNLSILLIFILSSIVAVAQRGQSPDITSPDPLKEGIVKGKLLDEVSKQGVKFANAALFKIKDSTVIKGVMSDENGNFILKKVPFGTYYLVIDFIGYDINEISNIQISSTHKTFDAGSIIMKHSSESIEEVEVVGERDLVEYKIDRKVINISKNINASGGTIVDALENAPSLQVDIDGNVTMRGSSNFKVLIDGKPSVLDANDILQQIPASAVENVEIITNPSVKYDPDGTTGIINIIMKKQHKTGFTGVVNASIGTGDKYSTDFLLNYKSKRSNFYIGANWGDRTHAGTGSSYRETSLDDTTFFLVSDSERDHQRDYYSVKAGFDLDLGKNDILSLSGNYGYFGFGMISLSNNYEYSNPTFSDIYKTSSSNYDVGGDYYSVNFDYKHMFEKKGHEITAAVYYSLRNGGNTTTTNESETNNDWTQIFETEKYKTFQDRAGKNIRIKVDYTLPINKNVKFEAGYQTRMMKGGGDYTLENLIDNNWILNEEYSNELVFIRDIHSIYSTITGQVFGIKYLAGLRGEYTDRIIDQRTTNEVYEVNRFDYFPSLHLTKELKKNQQLQAGYSRRIQRPRHWYLNPFPGFTDSYSVSIGNPGLLPEYIDSYDISYQKRIKQSYFNIEAYYRQKNNKISRVQELMDDGRILRTFDNLDKEYSFGTELSGNFRIQKWWMLYANINFYRYNIEGDVAGVTTNLKSINYDARMNTTFLFSKNIRLQLSGFYNAPSVTAQGERDGFYFFGAAYRHELFNKKLSIVLNVRDMFKTGNHFFTSSGEGFYSENERRREAPVFTLSLSYKINNYKQKKQERDENGNEFDDGGMM